ncbi:MAG: hypothetical protein AABZ77_08635 [Chloroflexota bacterium]
MSDQMQCPNCGGFRVETKQERKFNPTGNYIPINRAIRIIGIPILILGFPFALPSLLFSEKIRDDFYEEVIKGRRKEIKYTTTIYHCNCNLCYYKWDWDVRDPKPEAHVRPDIIQKGAKKLEEEQAAAAIAQQNAAAAQYLSQQRHKH